MMAVKDIDRWYGSAHYRKKVDWVCIDQPKVIQEWVSRVPVRAIVLDKKYEDTDTWWDTWQIHDTQVKNRLRDVVQYQSTGWFSNLDTPCRSGMIVVFDRPALCDQNQLDQAHKIVLLDGIQDPGNMGTIIRTMCAFGVTTLCLTTDCVDPLHPKSVRASSGAIAHLNYFTQPQWEDWLPNQTRPMYVLDPKGDTLCTQIPGPNQFILVCGSEGQGIRAHGVQSYDNTVFVQVPMVAGESLNAAVSLSISLFLLR